MSGMIVVIAISSKASNVISRTMHVVRTRYLGANRLSCPRVTGTTPVTVMCMNLFDA
jgi:hypothetical protein